MLKKTALYDTHLKFGAKFVDFAGSATANYNEYDFIVKEKVGLTTFTMDTGSRVGTPVALAQCGNLLKYSLNLFNINFISESS